jgi:hypothetical protein
LITTSNPFCFGYFEDKVLFFAHASLESSLIFFLHFLPLGYQVCATTPSFFPLKWGVTNFFVQGDLNPQFS